AAAPPAIAVLAYKDGVSGPEDEVLVLLRVLVDYFAEADPRLLHLSAPSFPYEYDAVRRELAHAAGHGYCLEHGRLPRKAVGARVEDLAEHEYPVAPYLLDYYGGDYRLLVFLEFLVYVVPE